MRPPPRLSAAAFIRQMRLSARCVYPPDAFIRQIARSYIEEGIERSRITIKTHVAPSQG